MAAKQEVFPTITIEFKDAGFPTFSFSNWQTGIALGHVERAGLLMIREAMREQARLVTKMRTAAEALTTES